LRDAMVAFPVSLRADEPAVAGAGDELHINAVLLAWPSPGKTIVVPTGGNGIACVAVDGLTVVPIEGLDPDLGLVRVEGSVAAASATRFDGPAAAAWVAAVATGRWALAAELVGVARQALAGAIAYAADRRQYGRAIGSFQAVQHRLADAHAAIVGAADVVEEAARSGSPWAALTAKALAGRACEDAGRHSQQVYGAIGFTWEHDLHRRLRRGYVLDALLGDWRRLEVEIGERLERTRAVPRIGEL
jgi:alkylation response protein AidB-like acyl-CoA dehydrogenase